MTWVRKCYRFRERILKWLLFLVLLGGKAQKNFPVKTIKHKIYPSFRQWKQLYLENYTFGLDPKQSLKTKHSKRKKNPNQHKIIGWLLFSLVLTKHSSIIFTIRGCSIPWYIGALCYLKCIWFLWVTVFWRWFSYLRESIIQVSN